MSDEWEALRQIEVPVGAKGRVRAKVEAALDARAVRPRRRRPLLALAGVAAVGSIAAAAMTVSSRRAPGPRTVVVDAGHHVEVAVGRGHASIVGPAEAAIVDGGLTVRTGTVATLGAVQVTGGVCVAQVDGSAQVSVSSAKMTVRVFAGSAQFVTPSIDCDVIDLTTPAATATRTGASAPQLAAVDARSTPPTAPVDVPPAAPVDVPPAAPVDVPPTAPAPDDDLIPLRPLPATRPAHPRAAPPRAAAPATDEPDHAVAPPSPAPPSTAPPSTAPAPPADSLAAEVAAYRAVVATEARDPAAAIVAWQRFAESWPDSSLAQAAALRRIALLARLARRAELGAAARAFVSRYPHSPRRAEVERLVPSP